ncbi:hypothetical protein [uncultured Fibrobacter sp.]|uniref:hypothetical protein n=1 Tax=uncultured Fibrobacter sp. TaxID=261512 RepID=UPI0026340B02|nr:hypothetical protein [uncultured Fibrobacter sp.]
MKKLMVLLFGAALFFTGCAGTGSDDPEALDNALVGFTSSVQGSRWQEALDYVTSDEANEIATSDGYEFKEEYKVMGFSGSQHAVSRFPLSAEQASRSMVTVA